MCLDRDPCAPAVAPAPALPPLAGQDRWDISHAADTEVRALPSPPKPLGSSGWCLLPSHSRRCCPRHGLFAWAVSAALRALLLAADPTWTQIEVPVHSLHTGHANSLLLSLIIKISLKVLRILGFSSSPDLYFWHQKAALSITPLHLKSDLQPICC